MTHFTLWKSLILFVPNSYRIFFIFVVIYNLCLFASTFTSQNYNSQNYARCCCYYRLYILEKIKIAHFLYVKKTPSINDYWSIVWLFLHNLENPLRVSICNFNLNLCCFCHLFFKIRFFLKPWRQFISGQM